MRHLQMKQPLIAVWLSLTSSSFPQALIRWGGALLELAHFKQGKESTDMVQLVRVCMPHALSAPPSMVMCCAVVLHAICVTLLSANLIALSMHALTQVVSGTSW